MGAVEPGRQRVLALAGVFYTCGNSHRNPVQGRYY